MFSEVLPIFVMLPILSALTLSTWSGWFVATHQTSSTECLVNCSVCEHRIHTLGSKLPYPRNLAPVHSTEQSKFDQSLRN